MQVKFGGGAPATHCWSRDIPTVVIYMPTSLQHLILSIINCDWPTLANVRHIRKKGGKERAQTHIFKSYKNNVFAWA